MNMTTAQKQAFKVDMAANANTVLINGLATPINSLTTPQTQTTVAAAAVATFYNQIASPSFTVWTGLTSTNIVGMAIKMSDLGNLTTANSTRLQTSFQVRPNGFDSSNQDDRALFGGLFSVAGASGTRSNLLTAWQRLATFFEKIFATGTGTAVNGDLNTDGSVSGTGSPATLVLNGQISGQDVLNAWAS